MRNMVIGLRLPDAPVYCFAPLDESGPEAEEVA